MDPAKNLAELAAKKGHSVKSGFWPLREYPEDFPRGSSLTAITAQNVLAHVPDPVGFLKGCAEIMGVHTKLYVQTSQCNMQQLGEFDTVYHEHISFFTGHSFDKAAKLSGLQITEFATTPIHGTSCLVTLEKLQGPGAQSEGRGREEKRGEERRVERREGRGERGRERKEERKEGENRKSGRRKKKSEGVCRTDAT